MLVGERMYIVVNTRPEISHEVNRYTLSKLGDNGNWGARAHEESLILQGSDQAIEVKVWASMSLFVVIWCFPSSQFYEGIKNIIKERYLAGVEQLRLTLEVLKKCFFFRFTHLLMTNSRKSSQKNACVSGDSDVLLRLVHTTVCEVEAKRMLASLVTVTSCCALCILPFVK